MYDGNVFYDHFTQDQICGVFTPTHFIILFVYFAALAVALFFSRKIKNAERIVLIIAVAVTCMEVVKIALRLYKGESGDSALFFQFVSLCDLAVSRAQFRVAHGGAVFSRFRRNRRRYVFYLLSFYVAGEPSLVASGRAAQRRVPLADAVRGHRYAEIPLSSGILSFFSLFHLCDRLFRRGVRLQRMLGDKPHVPRQSVRAGIFKADL